MKHIYKNLNFYGIMELICKFIRLILQSIKLIYQLTACLQHEAFQPVLFAADILLQQLTLGHQAPDGIARICLGWLARVFPHLIHLVPHLPWSCGLASGVT